MAKRNIEFPLEQSVGYLIRAAHRRFIQDLQTYIVPQGITVGMWYFLRALWQEDGLTQRELSERVGSMGPTTAEQLDNMEKRGYIQRRRSVDDRRKIHVHLTPLARRVQAELLSYAKLNSDNALKGFSASEVAFLRFALLRIIENLDGRNSERSSSGAGGLTNVTRTLRRSPLPKRRASKA